MSSDVATAELFLLIYFSVCDCFRSISPERAEESLEKELFPDTFGEGLAERLALDVDEPDISALTAAMICSAGTVF